MDSLLLVAVEFVGVSSGVDEIESPAQVEVDEVGEYEGLRRSCRMSSASMRVGVRGGLSLVGRSAPMECKPGGE